MRYTVLIDGQEGGYGVVVPDFPGCTAMGATVEEALAHVVDAMRDWAEIAGTDHGTVPLPRPPEALRALPDVREALAEGAALASAPLIRETGKPAKANLSIDAGILAAIDAEAGRRKVARSALVEMMARQTLPRL